MILDRTGASDNMGTLYLCEGEYKSGYRNPIAANRRTKTGYRAAGSGMSPSCIIKATWS